MANYKNQLRINITDDNFKKIIHQKDTQSAFLQPLEWDKIMSVMNILSGNEFKVYMYLLKWKGQDHYDFSPADLEIQLDISENTVRKIRDTFIKMGFLVQTSKNTYIFDPFPETTADVATARRGERREKREA